MANELFMIERYQEKKKKKTKPRLFHQGIFEYGSRKQNKTTP